MLALGQKISRRRDNHPFAVGHRLGLACGRFQTGMASHGLGQRETGAAFHRVDKQLADDGHEVFFFAVLWCGGSGALPLLQRPYLAMLRCQQAGYATPQIFAPVARARSAGPTAKPVFGCPAAGNT